MNVCANRGGLEAAISLPCGFITVIVESTSPEGLTRGSPQQGGSEPPFFSTPLKPDRSLASPIAASFGPFPSACCFCTPEVVTSANAVCRAHAEPGGGGANVLSSTRSPSCKSFHLPSGSSHCRAGSSYLTMRQEARRLERRWLVPPACLGASAGQKG